MQRVVDSRVPFCAHTLATFIVFTLPLMAKADEQETAWQPGFTFAPYAWLAGVDGTKGAGHDTEDGGGSLPPRLDASTDHELNEIGFMLYSEWRGERWTAFFDYVWADVRQDGDLALGKLLPHSKAEVTFDGHIYQFGLGYRLLGGHRSYITAYGGGRFYNIESKVEASGGVLPHKITASTTRSWRDAVFGVRWYYHFGGRWSSYAAADYGFGDSKSAWHVFGNLGYDFSWGRIMAGYRYMNLDYETGTYKINVALSGPVLGAAIEF